MNTQAYVTKSSARKTAAVLATLVVIFAGAQIVAYRVQTDFGRVSVENVMFRNNNDVKVRGKLLSPKFIQSRKLPGVVVVHGYQNNRETTDPYSIELARRGFVTLSIDAVGRGNSGEPSNVESPDFDETYGTSSAVGFLRSLDKVDSTSIGLIGHSLGAEMAYMVALEDEGIRSLVITGFAYTEESTPLRPANMLMIFGKYDEFRTRMTGTDDVEAEWMSTPQTRAAIDHSNPKPSETYGSFSDGTARRVVIPPITHLMESHNRQVVSEAVDWMRHALNPPADLWIPLNQQRWPTKEWMTLIAMVSLFAALLPLGLLLIKLPFFSSVRLETPLRHAASGRAFWIPSAIHGIGTLLYLPLILVLFAIHIYLVPIDKAFPMMMVNGIVWWFVISHGGGLVANIFWQRKAASRGETDLYDLGVSYRLDRMSIDLAVLGRTVLLALAVFVFAFAAELIAEKILIVDLRFIFPFASDLTWYRGKMMLLYFPFLLFGFLCFGFMYHGRIRRRPRKRFLTTFLSWSATNIGVATAPILILLLAQYLPLFLFGIIPFVGPGGMFVTFMLNLFHLIGVMILVIPVSTWFYRITGRIYTGAILCALLVAWMFASSQVIAPVPV